MIGNNRPEWIWGEVAAHALGAMSLGIYQDLIGDEVSYLLAYAEAKIIIAEDEEQVDKLLDLIGHGRARATSSMPSRAACASTPTLA